MADRAHTDNAPYLSDSSSRTAFGWGRTSVAVPSGFHHPLAPVSPVRRPFLLPVLAVEDDITPALEALFAPAVHRAHAGDTEARNALYAAFEPKLLRFARRITVPFAPYGSEAIWGMDDVYQETFTVFAGVLEAWHDGIPFGRYVLANFPWRLRDAVHRGIGKRSLPPRLIAVHPEQTSPLEDPRSADQVSTVIVGAVADTLGPRLGDFLRLRVIDNMSQGEAREQMGLSDRTASRTWHQIRNRLGTVDDMRPA